MDPKTLLAGLQDPSKMFTDYGYTYYPPKEDVWSQTSQTWFRDFPLDPPIVSEVRAYHVVRVRVQWPVDMAISPICSVRVHYGNFSDGKLLYCKTAVMGYSFNVKLRDDTMYSFTRKVLAAIQSAINPGDSLEKSLRRFRVRGFGRRHG